MIFVAAVVVVVVIVDVVDVVIVDIVVVVVVVVVVIAVTYDTVTENIIRTRRKCACQYKQWLVAITRDRRLMG